jgi:hypothetical protein
MNSCRDCRFAVRRKDCDIGEFEGYYCRKYRGIVHDYPDASCKMWEAKA